jgi:prepilin-type N-terminal cleavage/methylation domain-containing protein
MAQPRPKFRRPRRPRSSAFTLIELVLVVIAVGVLSAIAVPKYSNSMNRYRVNIAAKRVVADLALARAVARASGAGQVVDFSTRANGYVFTGYAAPDGKTGDYIVLLSDDPYKVKISSVSFGTATPPAQTVTFTRFGVPELDGTIVVTCGDYSKSVVVDSITGRAEVK